MSSLKSKSFKLNSCYECIIWNRAKLGPLSEACWYFHFCISVQHDGVHDPPSTQTIRCGVPQYSKSRICRFWNFWVSIEPDCAVAQHDSPPTSWHWLRMCQFMKQESKTKGSTARGNCADANSKQATRISLKNNWELILVFFKWCFSSSFHCNTAKASQSTTTYFQNIPLWPELIHRNTASSVQIFWDPFQWKYKPQGGNEALAAFLCDALEERNNQ